MKVVVYHADSTEQQALTGTAAAGYSPNWNALLTATCLLTNAEHKRCFAAFLAIRIVLLLNARTTRMAQLVWH
jgi:hypothetical protein